MRLDGSRTRVALAWSVALSTGMVADGCARTIPEWSVGDAQSSVAVSGTGDDGGITQDSALDDAGDGAWLGAPVSIGTNGDEIQPSLVVALDGTGSPWVILGYTDLTLPAPYSAMGLSVCDPSGAWQTYVPLNAVDSAFFPSGDAWVATAQGGSRAYYVSLATSANSVQQPDDTGDGLALAIIDVGNGSPHVRPPVRIDSGTWSGWDEPTVCATHPPTAANDTVIVAGTPIDVSVQDVIAVLVSHDGGETFHYAPGINAPGYPGRQPGPANTVVRPFLQQDPRPGQECHAYLAYGVYFATALETSLGVRPPECTGDYEGCRSIAETETHDCGETWEVPRFIVVDTGPPAAPDYRSFSYAVANDGTRFVMFTSEDSNDTDMLLKRAAPGTAFRVRGERDGIACWVDGPMEHIGSDPRTPGQSVRKRRPTLSAATVAAAAWVEEDAVTHAASVHYSFSVPSAPNVWTEQESAAPEFDGIACDSLPNPLDNYMGVTPLAGFGAPASTFLAAWTPFFSPCDSGESHHILVAPLD